MEATSQSSHPDQPDPASPARSDTPAKPQPTDGKQSGKAEQLKIIGGLVALLGGLAALLIVLVISKWVDVDSDQFTQLATTVVGVIGSVVGAYFGVKIGTDGTQKALESQRQEAARSQIFAAHLDPDVAEKALELAFSSAPGRPKTPAKQAPVTHKAEPRP
jgi:hypothetical protein